MYSDNLIRYKATVFAKQDVDLGGGIPLFEISTTNLFFDDEFGARVYAMKMIKQVLTENGSLPIRFAISIVNMGYNGESLYTVFSCAGSLTDILRAFDREVEAFELMMPEIEELAFQASNTNQISTRNQNN